MRLARGEQLISVSRASGAVSSKPSLFRLIAPGKPYDVALEASALVHNVLPPRAECVRKSVNFT